MEDEMKERAVGETCSMHEEIHNKDRPKTWWYEATWEI
jgi:hypothetical protein